MRAMKKPMVVATNPIHYAVVLPTKAAETPRPGGWRKRVDAMAARIRAIAEDLRVPVITNTHLARELYQVEVDTETAPKHCKAKAEIIAYVWRADRPGWPEMEAPSLWAASTGGGRER